ncbi:IS3 family transposase, partial [Staphylococcus aureus]|nr:IS3 family transposase [Staphylococcus aureus]
MSKRLFTEDEIADLKLNKFVQNVTPKAITYKEEFREHFVEEYENGKLPSEIFREAGFNTKILGKRISNFRDRVLTMKNRPEGLRDTRKEKSGRPRLTEMTPEEEIQYLKHKVALQNQQIEALKKMNSINRRAS